MIKKYSYWYLNNVAATILGKALTPNSENSKINEKKRI